MAVAPGRSLRRRAPDARRASASRGWKLSRARAPPRAAPGTRASPAQCSRRAPGAAESLEGRAAPAQPRPVPARRRLARGSRVLVEKLVESILLLRVEGARPEVGVTDGHLLRGLELDEAFLPLVRSDFLRASNLMPRRIRGAWRGLVLGLS